MNGFEIKNAKGGKATIYVYQDIGEDWFSEDGLTARRFADELKALGDVLEINVRINSPGGSVFDARAMASLLRGHPARVEVDIDGICASAATYIACVGETCRIAEDGIYMIHPPLGVCVGSATEMEKTAEMLDVIQNGMVEIYSKRSGRDAKEIGKLIDAETWMDAEQAVELGFCDSISATRQMSATADARKLPRGRLPFRKMPEKVKDRIKLEHVGKPSRPAYDAARERLAAMNREISMAAVGRRGG